MNRCLHTIRVLFVLSAFVAGIVVPRDGSSLQPAELNRTPDKSSSNAGGRASVLEYYRWLLSASAEDREAQFKRLSAIGADRGSRVNLVLAVTLMLPDAPFTDFERAKVLLVEYLRNPSNEEPEDLALAELLLVLLDEVARLEAQLDQLKAIEKDITETERSVNVPAPAPESIPASTDSDEREEDTSSR
jgi:hypothetical protein